MPYKLRSYVASKRNTDLNDQVEKYVEINCRDQSCLQKLNEHTNTTVELGGTRQGFDPSTFQTHSTVYEARCFNCVTVKW
jgi:hypothetical protein